MVTLLGTFCPEKNCVGVVGMPCRHLVNDWMPSLDCDETNSFLDISSSCKLGQIKVYNFC